MGRGGLALFHAIRILLSTPLFLKVQFLTFAFDALWIRVVPNPQLGIHSLLLAFLIHSKRPY